MNPVYLAEFWCLFYFLFALLFLTPLKSSKRTVYLESGMPLTASNNAFYFPEGDKMKLRMQRLCKAINS